MDSPQGDQDGPDDLDAALLVWAREIPSLDPLTEGVVERIHILAHHLNESMSETLAEFHLDRRWFRLLGRLRSYGPPYRRSAGMLAADLQLSSGAMTNRLDRMEKAGLIRRLPDPSARRGTLVAPRAAGRGALAADPWASRRRLDTPRGTRPSASRVGASRRSPRSCPRTNASSSSVSCAASCVPSRTAVTASSPEPRLMTGDPVTESTRAIDAIDAAGI